MRRALSFPVLFASLLALGASGCRPEPKPRPPRGPCPPGVFQPGCVPGQPPPQSYPRPGGSPLAPPAFGMICVTDQDLVCPYGRCIQGRCGGCLDDSHCKPGSTCSLTPMGLACVPGMGAPSAPPPRPGQPVPGPAPAPSSSLEAARQACVHHTNQHRASVGAAPLARRPDREACIDREARDDAAAGAAHATFGNCGEMAQNTCPDWRGPPAAMVGRCLQSMFDEGPGSGPAHGHYNNMTDRKYTGVACGFHVTPSGDVWLVQNFY